jgi:hypothetical protein
VKMGCDEDLWNRSTTKQNQTAYNTVPLPLTLLRSSGSRHDDVANVDRLNFL